MKKKTGYICAIFTASTAIGLTTIFGASDETKDVLGHAAFGVLGLPVMSADAVQRSVLPPQEVPARGHKPLRIPQKPEKDFRPKHDEPLPRLKPTDERSDRHKPLRPERYKPKHPERQKFKPHHNRPVPGIF